MNARRTVDVENGRIPPTASRSASASATCALSGFVRVRRPSRCRPWRLRDPVAALRPLAHQLAGPQLGESQDATARLRGARSRPRLRLDHRAALIRYRRQDALDHVVGEAARFRGRVRERLDVPHGVRGVAPQLGARGPPVGRRDVSRRRWPKRQRLRSATSRGRSPMWRKNGASPPRRPLEMCQASMCWSSLNAPRRVSMETAREPGGPRTRRSHPGS